MQRKPWFVLSDNNKDNDNDNSNDNDNVNDNGSDNDNDNNKDDDNNNYNDNNNIWWYGNSQVMADGKTAVELIRELSSGERADLMNYYKDDFAIGGYDQSMDVLKWLLFRGSIKWW